jgi:hypothetical protein
MANIKAAGASFAFATAYATAVSITAATNANPCVLTLAASHGVLVGDFVEMTTFGWGRVEGRIFRVSVVATNDVTLEGFNSTDVDLYPAGEGVGSLRRITAWTPITQVGRSIEVSGGEITTGDVTYIIDSTEKSIPLYRTGTNLILPVFFDPSLSWVPLARAATEANAVRALRAIWPGGARTIFNGYLSYREAPSVDDGTLRTTVELQGTAQPTTYSN